MDEFLATCKARANEEFSKCLVVGNLHGNFGSILSAISLAFYMQNRRLHNEEDSIDYYIPILYTHRDVIDTKTDVLYYLDKFGVKSDDLLCLDDIHIDNFDMIIMVDYTNPHIYLAFDETLVKMVFTKTEEEYDFNPPVDCERVYKPAVSIATVVADYIVRHDPQNLTDDDKLSLKILYDCIIYKTNNCRVCNSQPHDVQMLSDLEGFLGVPDESYGEVLLNELVTAQEDYTTLNPLQLLYKYSAGMVTGNEKAVYIAYLPIGIREFFEMPAFRTGVAELAEWMACNVMIVIGTSLDDENNTKEYVGVVSFNDSCLYKKILDKLLYDSELKLCYRGWFLGFNGKWYRNYNPEVTIQEIKDSILPILNA